MTAPLIVSVRDLPTARPDEGQAVILYLTSSDLKTLTRDVKPLPDTDVRGVGLEIIPLPQRQGFLGFAVCGPDESPTFRGGVWHCIRTEYKPPRSDIPPSPPDPCAFTLKNGVFVCSGVCDTGSACISGQRVPGRGPLRLSCSCPL